MKTHKSIQHRVISTFTLTLTALLLCFSASDGLAIIWNGSGGDDGWETGGNWDTVLAPVFSDDVKFDSIDSDVPAGTINNVVSNSLTIRTLWYANMTQTGGTNNYHTTLIPAGSTLSVIGDVSLTSFLVGSGVDSGASVTNYTAFKGAGTLLVSNATGIMNVRQGGAGGSANTRNIQLNLSELDTFNAVVSQLLIAGDGVGTSGFGRLEGGTLTLAKTNVIALTSEPAMIVGGYTSANLCVGTLNLGQSNLFLCNNTMYVGTYRSTGTMKFDSALANPVAVFRGLDGVSRGGNLIIGHNRGNSANVARPSRGIVDLSGGTVDGLISSIYVGRGQNYNNAPSVGVARGDLAISKGVMDVLNVSIGARRQGYAAAASGTVTVGNTAQLIVDQWIEFGLDIAVVATNLPCSGTLNITNGGFVWVKDSLYDSGFGTNIISINTGHLKVGNYLAHPASRPFDEIDLTNATLTLTVNSLINSTNPVGAVTNLNTAGWVALRVVAQDVPIGQYPLIKYYGGGIGGDGFSVITNKILPPRTQGYISNNIAGQSIDLVVTNSSPILWNGNVVGGVWDINSTANWIEVSTSTTTTYLEDGFPGDAIFGDAVYFDDSASGTTTIDLTATVSPALISITNSSKTYVFGGAGKISGTAPFNKNGNGLVILTNAGANDFSGDVNLNDGTLRLGLAADRLPVSANVIVADLATAGLELDGQNQTVGSLTGGGPNGGNVSLGAGNLTTTVSGTYNGVISGGGMFRKTGGGTQTLTGANTYSGGTYMAGTVTLLNTSGSGLGTGPIEIASGTLNVGNGTGGGTVAAGTTVTNNGGLVFNTTNDLTFAAIHGSGAVTKNNTNTVTITGSGTYSGATTITLGALRISDGGALGSTAGTTTIPSTADTQLELMGDITVAENFSISQKPGAALESPHFLNVSGNNTLTGTITGGSGGSYYSFRSDAGKLTVNGTFVVATTGNRYIRLYGAADGEWITPYSDGSGVGRVYKGGTGTWTLSGINTYSGITGVWGGKLLVNGEIQSLSTVYVGDPDPQYSGTLGGTGVIYSAVLVDTNGVFSPGNPFATDTITILNALTMLPGSTNIFDVHTDYLSHDLATGMSSVTYGGTLVFNFFGLDTAITNGASIPLFTGPNPTYSGAFDAIVPATPGPGLFWNTGLLAVNGTLQVVDASFTSPSNLVYSVTGNELSVSWPANHIGWRLEGQTNDITVGIANNWFTVPGSSGTNQVIMPVDPQNGAVFYRLVYP